MTEHFPECAYVKPCPDEWRNARTIKSEGLPVPHRIVSGSSGRCVECGAGDCICDELRACEERVKRVERPLSFLKGATYGRDCGWDEALDAAEAAVNEVLDRTPNAMNGEYITVSKHFPADLIAAIRVLKEKP